MKWPHIPLYVRVLIGVALGAIVGIVFGRGEIVLGATTADLGRIGLLVVRALKMLAIPLVFFAIVDAIARTNVTGRMGMRLVAICMFNVTIAFLVGVTIMNLFHPGEAWRGHLDELAGLPDGTSLKQAPAGTSLSPFSNLDKWIPETAIQPFADNNVISVVLLAILAGAALRRTLRTSTNDEADDGAVRESAALVARFVEGVYHVIMRMLGWVIATVPFAVFGVVAQVVGKSGIEAFTKLWVFLVVILAGFAIHALVYYPLLAWLVGKRPPREYLGKGADAIVTGLSTNSSLATVPITLRCLDRMGISPESSRLAACIGTNLNNDGITLYEAMAALFLAQALGYDLPASAQLTIVLASLMAGIGIAGIPEAGLIVLPLVLGAAGLPEPIVAALIPVVFTVDWILARCRSAVNVMSDMVVAIVLDRFASKLRHDGTVNLTKSM